MKISRTSYDILVQERDQMAPDAVQYARALRPPYHLLSFLRCTHLDSGWFSPSLPSSGSRATRPRE